MTSQDRETPDTRAARRKGRGKNKTRRVAANMLAAILRGKTLDEARDRLSDLRDGERNLADAMVQTALRHYGGLEKILRSYVKKMPPRASPARALLFIGAAQLLHMKVPPHAAIDETVAATGRREQPYRGMINAVLRNIARAQQADTLPAYDPLDNLPDWLRENWLAAYGADKTAAIADALAVPPPLDLCFKNPTGAADWQKKHGGMALGPTHIRVDNGGDITRFDGFAEGDFWVQNYAAGQPALMLLAQLAPASHVLDICAAPGGKTLQLAAGGHRVTALDKSAPRLTRLKDNLARTALQAETICADAPHWLSETERFFDAILLDAPCTATGTLRRHPDLLRHRTSGDMAALVALQKEILSAAAQRLTAGGYLAYGVCSIQTQEGEDQITAFLAAHDNFVLHDRRAFLPVACADRADERDGFYIAVLQKTAELSDNEK